MPLVALSLLELATRKEVITNGYTGWKFRGRCAQDALLQAPHIRALNLNFIRRGYWSGIPVNI